MRYFSFVFVIAFLLVTSAASSQVVEGDAKVGNGPQGSKESDGSELAVFFTLMGAAVVLIYCFISAGLISWLWFSLVASNKGEVPEQGGGTVSDS
jgi:hypothetical protein